ncbi:MAG: hypothetical protein KDD48_04240 [Bdellovibrionales bacterium]|nr:hypothetical protein [Bdellovibrionales bacterium]
MNKVSVKKYVLAIAVLSLASAWGAGFIDHENGVPYRWSTSAPIPCFIDSDPLINVGNSISNPTAKGVIKKAFQSWELLNLTGTDVVDDNLLVDTDTCQSISVNETNYTNYIRIDENGFFENIAPNNAGIYIIFDKSGLILKGLLEPFGVNTQNILGIASPGKYVAAQTRIEAGFILINGAFSQITVASLAYTATHEIGHLFNLSHTQLNFEEGLNNSAADDNVVPLMFPYISDKTVTLTDPNIFPGLIERDDEFSMAFLYPNGNALSTRASITGKIKRRNGEFVRGVHTICRDNSDPREIAISWVSDQTYQGNGQFECGNLDAGLYTLEIEPLALGINSFDPYPPFIPSEFYNQDSESYDPDIDDRTQSTFVTVSNAQETSNIDVLINEDGRLFSGQTVEGTIAGEVQELEYFITVPAGASSLRIDMTSSYDLSLLARCANEFSLTSDITSPPYLDLSGGSQQAEYVSSTPATGNESIVITKGSNPPLKACTYHIVANDYFAFSAVNPQTFELTATIQGPKPKLKISKSEVNIKNLTGNDVYIARQVIEAKGDDFDVSTIVFNDIGTDSMDNVTGAKLYRDTDQNGTISESDELIAQSSQVDTTERKVVFSGLSEYISSSDGVVSYFLVYEVVSTSGYSWPLILCLVGLIVGVGRRRKPMAFLSCVCVGFLLFISCAKTDSVSGFEPQINQVTSIEARGLAFGEEFQIDLDITFDSVSDFFD